MLSRGCPRLQPRVDPYLVSGSGARLAKVWKEGLEGLDPTLRFPQKLCTSAARAIRPLTTSFQIHIPPKALLDPSFLILIKLFSSSHKAF